MKNFGPIFLWYYRVRHTSGENIKGHTRCFGTYDASYKIISETPKMLLKTQNFEKKAMIPVKKRFWPIFSRIIECDKPQGTI